MDIVVQVSPYLRDINLWNDIHYVNVCKQYRARFNVVILNWTLHKYLAMAIMCSNVQQVFTCIIFNEVCNLMFTRKNQKHKLLFRTQISCFMCIVLSNAVHYSIK